MDNIFVEHLFVLKKKTRPIMGLYFMRKNRAICDKTHGLKQFHYLAMQAKTASSEANAKHQNVITSNALTLPIRTTKTLTSFVDQAWEKNTTDTVRPLEKYTENGDFPFKFKSN